MPFSHKSHLIPIAINKMIEQYLTLNYVIMSTSLSFTVGGCKAKNGSILCYCENIHVLFVVEVKRGLF